MDLKEKKMLLINGMKDAIMKIKEKRSQLL